MKIKREIASVPVRSAAETWDAIVKLISGPETADADTLAAAASVIQSLIADEHPAVEPITVKGNGGRLVIYCAYHEVALDIGTDIDPLTWNPTGGAGWSISAPTEAADVVWMNNVLKQRAPRITVFDVANPPVEEDDARAAAAGLAIDWGVLSKS